MTIGQFYCRASLLPVLLPVAAGIGVGLLSLTASPQALESGAAIAVVGVAYTGLFSTIPYLVYLMAVLSKSRRESWSPAQIRRWIWAGPLVIAGPVAALAGLRAFIAQEWESGFAGAIFVGFWTLLIGYVYVGLIEAARVIATHAGIVRPEVPG